VNGLTEIMEAANKAYGWDTIHDCHTDPDNDHGDGLAAYIVSEIKDVVSDGADGAIIATRLKYAAGQLRDVATALNPPAEAGQV